MNLRKTLAALVLSTVSLAVLACQYTTGYLDVPDSYVIGGDIQSQKLERRRYIYLSGINTPGNHISGVSYNRSGYSMASIISITSFPGCKSHACCFMLSENIQQQKAISSIFIKKSQKKLLFVVF